jgi:acetylornithine deacetylase/succinyl-diaminopimelate desuccinylase-like protein
MSVFVKPSNGKMKTLGNDSLQFESYEFVPGHPTLILSWIGSNPSLQSIVLSGHMDVVPVEIDKWILLSKGGRGIKIYII